MDGIKLLNDSDFRNFVDKNRLALIDFYADWCGPCHMIKPVLEELKKEMGEDIAIGKVDLDRNREKAMKYGVMSIPTLLLFRKGRLVDRIVGAVQKEIIEQRVRKFL